MTDDQTPDDAELERFLEQAGPTVRVDYVVGFLRRVAAGVRSGPGDPTGYAAGLIDGAADGLQRRAMAVLAGELDGDSFADQS